jgi:hypothetical protein
LTAEFATQPATKKSLVTGLGPVIHALNLALPLTGQTWVPGTKPGTGIDFKLNGFRSSLMAKRRWC